MVWVVIIAGVVAVIAVVAWFLLTRNHPEQADRHARDRPHVDEMGRGTGAPEIIDRPAGPDAESMAPEPHPRPAPPGPPSDDRRSGSE